MYLSSLDPTISKHQRSIDHITSRPAFHSVYLWSSSWGPCQPACTTSSTTPANCLDLKQHSVSVVQRLDPLFRTRGSLLTILSPTVSTPPSRTSVSSLLFNDSTLQQQESRRDHLSSFFFHFSCDQMVGTPGSLFSILSTLSRCCCFGPIDPDSETGVTNAQIKLETLDGATHKGAVMGRNGAGLARNRRCKCEAAVTSLQHIVL